MFVIMIWMSFKVLDQVNVKLQFLQMLVDENEILSKTKKITR